MATISKPTAEDVGRRLGLSTLTDEQTEHITDAIIEAAADVELAIGRPIIPVRHTLTRRSPSVLGGDLSDARTWRLLEEFDDKARVVTYTALTGVDAGLYDLVVDVGLDGAKEAPIVRWITAAAAATIRNRPELGMGKRLVQSVSAEGQSVSYASGSVADGAAGSEPNLTKLARYYGKRAAYRRPRAPEPVFPYTSPRGQF